MKNYLDQLATELYLRIEVNGQRKYAGLLDHFDFAADQSVLVDDLEILPKYQHLARDGRLLIQEPFYCWYHRVSGQGWLLKPH